MLIERVFKYLKGKEGVIYRMLWYMSWLFIRKFLEIVDWNRVWGMSKKC